MLILLKLWPERKTQSCCSRTHEAQELRTMEPTKKKESSLSSSSSFSCASPFSAISGCRLCLFLSCWSFGRRSRFYFWYFSCLEFTVVRSPSSSTLVVLMSERAGSVFDGGLTSLWSFWKNENRSFPERVAHWFLAHMIKLCCCWNDEAQRWISFVFFLFEILEFLVLKIQISGFAVALPKTFWILVSSSAARSCLIVCSEVPRWLHEKNQKHHRTHHNLPSSRRWYSFSHWYLVFLCAPWGFLLLFWLLLSIIDHRLVVDHTS